VRAEFREMVLELVHYRELLWQMVLRDLRIRYKQAVMGFGWAVFMPLVIVGAGFLVKYAMGQMSGKPVATAELAGMVVKALGWSFFVGTIGFATNSLTGNINLVGKIYFPREVFPLAAVITQAFDSLVGTAVMSAVLVFLLHVSPSWQWWWLAPLVLMMLLFTTAVSLFLSCANVFFRDVKYLVQILISFGIFFTPVFYEPELLGQLGSVLMMLNPLSPILEGVRLSVVEHHNLLVPVVGEAGFVVWHPWHLAYAAAWSVLGLLGAWWMFHRLEYVYAEYI
jgi:ABC-type polysaccharide/polyol phosphate export permease